MFRIEVSALAQSFERTPEDFYSLKKVLVNTIFYSAEEIYFPNSDMAKARKLQTVCTGFTQEKQNRSTTRSRSLFSFDLD
jgi:hypothetical protein